MAIKMMRVTGRWYSLRMEPPGSRPSLLAFGVEAVVIVVPFR